jgi:cell division control protein 12
MHDLVESTKEEHYEEFRARQLTGQGRSDEDQAGSGKRNIQAKMKEDEDALRKRFAEQVRLEETRFRQWEQKVNEWGGMFDCLYS